MLVRNNTKCPHCGKLSAVDVYVPFHLPQPSRGLVVRVECFDCLSFKDTVVQWVVLHGWIRSLACEAKGLIGQWACAKRWPVISNLSGGLSPVQRLAVLRQAHLYLSGGVCLLQFVESPALRKIYCALVNSGDLVEAVPWEMLDYAWCRL